MSAKTFVHLSDHGPDRQGAGEADGNGRTGVFVKLTVKQVSIVLGIATTLAGGYVAIKTHEPKPETKVESKPAPNVPVDPRLQDLVDELRAMSRELADVKDDGRYTRGQVLGLREDVRDLKRAVRAIEQARADRDVGNGGGSR